MSALHRDAVDLLSAWTPPNAEQAMRQEAYVRHLRAHDDALWRWAVPDHLTASAVVLDAAGEHTLLTLHAKAQAWFQLGGHCEADDLTLAGAALREASEESGLAPDALRIDPQPVQLSPHPVPFCRPPGLGADEVVHHLDVRFLVVADRVSTPTVSEESLDVRWWSVERLPCPEPALLDAVRLARERLSYSSSPGGGSRLAAADQPDR